MNYRTLIIRANRWAAWLLLPIMLLYLVSGYGMTKGIITPRTAAWLHLDVLAIPFLVTFCVHAGTSVWLALVRRRLDRNRFLMAVVVASFAVILIYFLLLETGII